MSQPFVRGEEGQALVIAAFAMVALMGALALTIDWGYGLAARRASQNEADAAALAVGRLLAARYVDNTLPFGVNQEEVWAAACAVTTRNKSGTVTAHDRTMGVWFSADPPTRPFSTGPTSTWNGLTASSNDCTLGPSGTTPVAGNTVFVRVDSSAKYTSLFGILSRTQLEVGAAARIQLTGAGSSNGPVVVPLAPVGDATVGAPGLGLSGASTAPNVGIWPIVIHYDPLTWTSAGSEITLIDWDSRRSPQQADTNLFVSLAHYSPNEQTDLPQTHQLLTESDYTGTGSGHHGHPNTSRLASAPGTCGGQPWDTNGSADLSRAADCDIPNWFNYGYRGSVSIGTSWDDRLWRGFEGSPQPVEGPDSFPGPRSSCAARTRYPFFAVPSCPDSPSSSSIGDWVETVKTGVDRLLVANQMRAFIARYGRVDPATGETAVVVNVFLWDCGERFNPGALPPDPSTRDRWSIVPGTGSDCSSVSGSDLTSVDRVHLLTVVPMTISMSDVDTTQRRRLVEVFVTARWGNAFGSAGNCAVVGCALSPLMNSAFLVPDE